MPLTVKSLLITVLLNGTRTSPVPFARISKFAFDTIVSIVLAFIEIVPFSSAEPAMLVVPIWL